MQYLHVYAVCVVMVTSGIIVLGRRRRPIPCWNGEAQDVESHGFMQRLSVKYRTAELWAVSSKNHYLGFLQTAAKWN